MVFNYLSIFSRVCLALIGVVTAVKGSPLEEFFRWIYLGGLLDFVYSGTWFLVPILAVGSLLQWTRDWRFLLGIFVFLLLVIKFFLTM